MICPECNIPFVKFGQRITGFATPVCYPCVKKLGKAKATDFNPATKVTA